MDLATIIGLISGVTLLTAAIMMGGAPGIFINIPSVLIVIGGTFAVTLIRFPMKQVLNSMLVAKNVFLQKLRPPDEVIREFVELSTISRKEGLLALENVDFDDPFMEKAINYCVDGADIGTLSAMLLKELEYSRKRHQGGAKVFKSIGDAAPSFGMIGTLVGLVQMLVNLDDPKSLGPAMAVAILTTLYGSVIANFLAIPIAEKLELRSDQETRLRKMIIEGVMGLKRGENPRMLEESLQSFMAPKARKSFRGAA